MTQHTISAKRIGSLAVEAMLYEVSATPKPGLVDRQDNGAHYDMDFFTFMASAAALRNAFDTFASIGKDNSARSLQQLFLRLQKAGCKMERNMLRQTQGVNTHKGMIFSLGLLAGIAGWINDGDYTAKQICQHAASMCSGLCASAFEELSTRETLTRGEQMFLLYQAKGVRGEAESGFQTVRFHALPHYRRFRDNGQSINDALVNVLIHLMAVNDDTNILGRHNQETLINVQHRAKHIIQLGGMQTAEGRKAINSLNEYCIEHYISPGGSADLVAVTHFLYELESINHSQA